MTESTAPTQAAAPKPASFWEDLIDIFYQPSAVYRRRAQASAWPPFLFVVVALAVITFATFPSVQAAFEGDYARNITKVMATNKQMTQEMADKGQHFQALGIQYFSGAFIAIAIVIVGFFTWVLGKFFGAVEGFSAAMLIASYAYMPRVIGAVLTGLQGLLMDPSKLTSVSQLTISPAHFLDPNTASPIVMAVLSRLDVMVIWETVLLGIGLAVIGRITRGKAAGFALLIWIVGSLYQLRAAYMIS
jgi:hypothetical protein